MIPSAKARWESGSTQIPQFTLSIYFLEGGRSKETIGSLQALYSNILITILLQNLAELKINYLSNASIIHKENENEFFTVICQNQTCSKKLKNIQEIENYLENLHNVQ